MAAPFSYRHRVVSEAEVAFIRQLIREHPTASRRALSKKLCQAWNWVQANGALRDMLCRGLMLQLYRAGLIELPGVRQIPRNPLAERSRPVLVPIEAVSLRSRLADIRPLEFHQVRRTPEEALFNSLLEQYHYLHYMQPVGEQLKYLIYAQGRPIACLAWSSAVRHLASRDRFIGWSAEARRRNIRFIAYNSRFLILPWVDVFCLASHLLSRMAEVVSRDWEQLYGHRIYFLETFIDPERFRGSCYRAANWTVLGRTTGRGKNAPSKRANRPIKQVLGYPLHKDFRQLLAEI
jgi:Domain of unknown function (DUF4338)